MKIFRPKTEKEIQWLAGAHEEVGTISIYNYQKTEAGIKRAIERIKSWLNNRNYRILIAEYETLSIPSGMIICGIQKSSLDNKLELFIESLYVTPSEREKGIGRRLLEEAYKWGQKNKVKRVKALVAYTNINMIKLCKTLGYSKSYITFEKTI